MKSITFEQKIIRVGSSSGVLVPAKDLKSLGVTVGDTMEVTIRLSADSTKDDALLRDYQKFTQQYGQTLKDLADR